MTMISHNSALPRQSMRWGILGLVWIVAAIVGGIGIVQRVLHGDHAADFSSYIPWGLWVAAYIYFSGLSAGAFFVAAGAYLLEIKILRPIGKLALLTSAVALLSGLLAIGFDLGHMERAFLVFLRPQFHSMMAWMVWMYTAYLILLAVLLALAVRVERDGRTAAQQAADRSRLKVLSLLGLPLVVAFAGGVGALFGTVAAREYWHSALFPIFFLLGAMMSGTALLAAIVAWFWPRRDEAWSALVAWLGRTVLILIVVDFLLEWAEYSIPAWYQIGSGYTLIKYVLFGPYWYVFWIVHLLAGVVIPVILLWRSRRAAIVGLASALVAVSFFAVRLNLVIPGLITPELRGLEHSYSDPISHRLSFEYLPTWFEWQVLVGILAIGAALFYLGLRFIPLLPNHSTTTREVAP